MTIRGQFSLAEATLAPRIGSFWALLEMKCEKEDLDSSCTCGSADYILLTENHCVTNEFIVVVIISTHNILIKFRGLDSEERHG